MLRTGKSNYFKISDFSYLDDIITTDNFSDTYSDKLKAKLVKPSGSKDLTGAFLKFIYDGEAIGEAHIKHDEQANEALTDIDRYLELAILNADQFNITPLKKYWKTGTVMSVADIYESLVVKGSGFKNNLYSFDDWKDANNKERSEVLAYNLNYIGGDDYKVKSFFKQLNKLPNETTENFSMDLLNSIAASSTLFN